MNEIGKSHIERLDWDSDFFGYEIARLKSDILTENQIDSVFSECAEKKIDCLFARLHADVPENVRVAEKNKFMLMSTRASYDATFSDRSEIKVPIRVVSLKEMPILQVMSRELSHESRFARDPRFGNTEAERLYEVWVEKIMQDTQHSTKILVAHIDDVPAGFIAASVKKEVVHIELIFVDRQFRGKAVGRALLQECINQYLDEGRTKYEVATQGSNVPAQRLYQACGFKISKMELDYHKWFSR